MRKFLFLILLLLVACALLGCGNSSMGFGNYTFEKAHVDTYHFSGCLTVEKWYDYESGVELVTEEAGNIFLADGMYVLLKGEKDCPFCAVQNDLEEMK